jgi:APA family basic amino acid/polyamine antiporter
VLQEQIINSLFSSDWNNVTFIAGEIKEPKKNIPRSLFLGTLIVTVIYVLLILLFGFITNARNSNAADIANGIMFASNDRVERGGKYDYGKCWCFVMAALIMVSFGCMV